MVFDDILFSAKCVTNLHNNSSGVGVGCINNLWYMAKYLLIPDAYTLLVEMASPAEK